MNKHILLVMKWLNNKDSVSQKELEKSRGETFTGTRANYETHNAAFCAAESWPNNDTYWVDKYFEETGEDRA